MTAQFGRRGVGLVLVVCIALVITIIGLGMTFIGLAVATPGVWMLDWLDSRRVRG